MQADEYRRELEALRDKLKAAIEVAEPNMLPQLAGQYRATLSDLASLPKAEGKSARERLAERVAAANVAS